MKDDHLFRDDVSPPPVEDRRPLRDSRGSRGRVRKILGALVIVVALAAGGLILYGILQLFVCDLREIVFKGAARRAVWLCR